MKEASKAFEVIKKTVWCIVNIVLFVPITVVKFLYGVYLGVYITHRDPEWMMVWRWHSKYMPKTTAYNLAVNKYAELRGK